MSCAREPAHPKTPFPDPPEDGRAGPVGGRRLAGHLIERLEATPPATPVWTWFEADQRPASWPDAAPTSWPCTATTPSPPAGSARRSPPSWPPTGSTRSSTSWSRPASSRRRAAAGCCPCGAADLGRRVAGHPRAATRSTWSVAPRTRHRREDSDLVVSGTTSDLELTLYHRPDPEPGGRARRLHRARGVAPPVHVLSRGLSRAWPDRRAAPTPPGVRRTTRRGRPARPGSRTWWPSCGRPRRSSRRRT